MKKKTGDMIQGPVIESNWEPVAEMQLSESTDPQPNSGGPEESEDYRKAREWLNRGETSGEMWKRLYGETEPTEEEIEAGARFLLGLDQGEQQPEDESDAAARFLLGLDKHDADEEE